MLATYLRLAPAARGVPAAYDQARAADAGPLVAELTATGACIVAHEADLADPATPARLFDAAEDQLGPVDVLVNNASGWRQDSSTPAEPDAAGRRAEPVTDASFEANFAVDARAAALLIAEFSRRHLARGGSWGRIVGLTSGGPMGFPAEVSYGAAKAALDNYTMAPSTELAPHGVTANVVHPPVTDTGWVTDEVRRFVAESPDHHHVAAAADVAEVVTWLCSDAAWFVTGNVLRLR